MLTLREFATDTEPDSASLRAVSFAGTFAALSASLLICRVPEAHPGTLSARALLWIACKYLVTPAAIGLGATWLYFQSSTQLPSKVFRSLVRCLGEAWLFFPAFTLLLWENSPAMLVLAPIAAVAVTLSLERFLPVPSDPALLTSGQLFAEPPPLPSRRRALYTALALVAAIAEIADGDLATAGFILSLVSYLLIRQWSGLTRRPYIRTSFDGRAPRNHRPPGAKRLGASLMLALLLTVIALVPWLRTSSHFGGRLPAAVAAEHSSAKHGAGETTADAYHAILLWPFPPKDNTLQPPPRLFTYRSDSSATPLVIPFDGSYRYFETPGLWSESKTHTAQGSPIDVNIHSADWGPLLMEAHQKLSTRIDLSCYRAIQMAIRNGDNRRGRVVLGLVLTDTTLSGKPSIIVEPQPVVSTQSGRYTFKTTPQCETLTFAIPDRTATRSTPYSSGVSNKGGSKPRQFDEITVLFLPDPERAALGTKIAIQSFTLIPR